MSSSTPQLRAAWVEQSEDVKSEVPTNTPRDDDISPSVTAVNNHLVDHAVTEENDSRTPPGQCSKEDKESTLQRPGSALANGDATYKPESLLEGRIDEEDEHYLNEVRLNNDTSLLLLICK